MIFSEQQIKAKSWLVTECVNLIMLPDQEVDKIFLIGSYASGKQTDWSDLDFLIQLTQQKEWLRPFFRLYPTLEQIKLITTKINSKRIHVVYGTENAAKSLHQKHKYEVKNYAYKEIINATTRASGVAS